MLASVEAAAARSQRLVAKSITMTTSRHALAPPAIRLNRATRRVNVVTVRPGKGQQRDDDVDPVATLTRRCGGVGVTSTRRNGSIDPDLLLALDRRRGRRVEEEAKIDVVGGVI
jgi:hypothetical protein